MMPDFPLLGAGPAQDVGANTATTLGTSISFGTPNVKSGWTQLIAASPFDTAWVVPWISAGSTGVRYLVDFAVGAAGSEQVIIPNLHYGFLQSGHVLYPLPLFIPKGSRLSARMQHGLTGTRSVEVGIHIFAGTLAGIPGYNIVKAYGQNLADSGLTAVAPAATIHTKGAWVELAAATEHIIRWLIVGGFNDAANLLAHAWLVDIGVGAAGSEQIVVPNLPFLLNATTDAAMPGTWPVLTHIPKGSRIAARAQGSLANDPIDVGLWGAG